MKTLEELQALPDEELRVICAEVLGWKWYRSGGGRVMLLKGKPANSLFEGPLEFVPEFMKNAAGAGFTPNYPQDLNACHEAEKTLSMNHYEAFRTLLRRSVRPTWRALISATARQRTIALILTLQSP